jgi:hypothetical protein
MDTYRKLIWGGIILAVTLILPLIIYFFFIKGAPAPASPPTSTDAETAEVHSSLPPTDEAAREKAPLEPEVLDIELNKSDEKLRELSKNCSSHPSFKAWLKNNGIIRRVTAVVDNIAAGESPAAHLEFLASPVEFKVKKRGDSVYVDPAGYKRYNGVTAVLVSLDSGELVGLYHRTKPLFEQAYKELGYPEGDFGEALLRAFSVLLNTPIPKGDILLEEKVRSYAYADPGLENMSPAQKHLLRMGPGNIIKIKTKIREIIEELRSKEIER